jgi:hypothetical protein
LSFSISILPFSLLPSERSARDRKNCTNQLKLGRGNCQKTE